MTGAVVGHELVFGCAEETTYGTAATVDRFYMPISETLERKNNVITSQGLRGGSRNLRSGTHRMIASHDAVGDVLLEVAASGFGRLLHAALGGTPQITSSGAAYTHVYPLGSVAGRNLTLQKQLRDGTGALIATHTFVGSKVVDAEFSINVNQFLQLRLTFDCQDVKTNVGAVTASYGTESRLFTFADASLSVNGSPVANILDCSVKIAGNLKVDAYYLGSGGLKTEPAPSDFPQVTGTMTAEVLDTSLYDLFAADGGGALVLTFTGDTIPTTAVTQKVIVTVPSIHLTGETPKVSGFGVITSPTPWEATAPSDGSAGMSVTYVTADTAP